MHVWRVCVPGGAWHGSRLVVQPPVQLGDRTGARAHCAVRKWERPRPQPTARQSNNHCEHLANIASTQAKGGRELGAGKVGELPFMTSALEGREGVMEKQTKVTEVA